MTIEAVLFRPASPVVIPANIVRLVPDEPELGGWFVVRGRFGWLYGSRKEALAAHRELAQEQRR